MCCLFFQPVRTSPPSLSRLPPSSLGAFPIRDQPTTNHSRGLAISPEEPVRLKANDPSTITTTSVSQQYTMASSGIAGPSGASWASPVFSKLKRQLEWKVWLKAKIMMGYEREYLCVEPLQSQLLFFTSKV